MDKIFITVLNMSFTGAFVIAALCVLRLAFRKAPKIISYCLWAVAGFRLLFPFSIESALSLIPFKPQPIPLDIALQQTPRIDSGISFINNSLSGLLPAATPVASMNPLQVWTTVGEFVWILGMLLMIVYGVGSYIMLKHKMRAALCVEGNIFEAENIKSPFLLGIFAPKIYLPAGLSEKERIYVILHEQTHIKRQDYIVKFLAYFILCLHWFNPFVWLAFILMGADMEMSCDERVLKEMGGGSKKEYSLSLLSLAAPETWLGRTHSVRPGPLAFGEGGVKERIKNILNFKKPSRVISIMAAVLALLIGVGFMMNREAERETEAYVIPEITVTETEEGAQITAQRFGYSWYDGEMGVNADSMAPWQGEYSAENTLVIGGAGQNILTLSAENPAAASYSIYLPDGTVYDDGEREMYDLDSLGPRLFWTEDRSGVYVHAPFEEGEYIYEVILGWEKDNLEVAYGFKVVMTGDGKVFTGLSDWDGETRPMTMADVRAIARKIGTELTMDELRPFTGTEVGSGLYMMRYEIEDSDYALGVSSGNPPEIWSAYLSHKSDLDGEQVIDIRYYDVDKYIDYGLRELIRPIPENERRENEQQETILPTDVSADADATLYEGFYQIVRKLYDMDDALNGGIKYIAVDMSEVPEGARESLEASLEGWVESMGLKLLLMNWDELVDSGYVTAEPIEEAGFHEGVLFTLSDIIFEDDVLKMNAMKYRGPLGAVGAGFTARFDNGVWTVGEPESMVMA